MKSNKTTARTGKDDIKSIAHEIEQLAECNDCGMSDKTMRSIATAIRGLISHVVATHLSREHAALYLGVSTRTLARLVEKGEIEPPTRRGFLRKSYSKASLDKFLHRQAD